MVGREGRRDLASALHLAPTHWSSVRGLFSLSAVHKDANAHKPGYPGAGLWGRSRGVQELRWTWEPGVDGRKGLWEINKCSFSQAKKKLDILQN